MRLVKIKNRKRKRTHGFLKRSKTNAGRNVIKRRRLAKRKRITI